MIRIIPFLCPRPQHAVPAKQEGLGPNARVGGLNGSHLLELGTGGKGTVWLIVQGALKWNRKAVLCAACINILLFSGLIPCIYQNNSD